MKSAVQQDIFSYRINTGSAQTDDKSQETASSVRETNPHFLTSASITKLV